MRISLDSRWLGGPESPLVPGYPQLMIEVRPIDTDLRDDADAVYSAILNTVPRDEEGRPIDPDGTVTRRAWRAYTRAFMEGGITAWQGFEDADGQPLALTPETVATVVRHADVNDGLMRLYVLPFLTRHAEGNVSAPSQGGTSGAPTTTAATTADVTRTTVPDRTAVAQPAPTSKTRLKRRRVAASGAS